MQWGDEAMRLLCAGNDGKHKDEANEHQRIHTQRSNVRHDHSHGCTKKGSLYIHW